MFNYMLISQNYLDPDTIFFFFFKYSWFTIWVQVYNLVSDYFNRLYSI